MRATELPGARDINVPGLLDIKDEIKVQQMRENYIDTASQYIMEMCDEKGNINDGDNLTMDELTRIKQIAKGIKHKGWMLYQSDMSGRMVLDIKEKPLNRMNEHSEVSVSEVRQPKLRLKNYCRNWAKILVNGSESGTGHYRRWCRGLVISYTLIPVLQGLRKDHKGNIDSDSSKGPKLCQLCAANTTPNAALGNLMSKLVRALVERK